MPPEPFGSTGSVLNSFTTTGFAIKTHLNDDIALGVFLNAPFGQDTVLRPYDGCRADYSGNSAVCPFLTAAGMPRVAVASRPRAGQNGFKAACAFGGRVGTASAPASPQPAHPMSGGRW